MKRIGLFAAYIVISFSAVAQASDRYLVKEITVDASIGEAWDAWTTEEGLRFVSAKSRVELRRGGAYEWFLDGPADEDGRIGGQGSQILAWLPQEMLAFSWTFSPATPGLRSAMETTQVIVNFESRGDGTVHVRLTAHEWQRGGEWDQGYEYFDAAWEYVLEAMKSHFAAE